MQAVVLAAGMGSRLGKYTENITKCMVDVNGRSLIDRLLTQLTKTHAVDKVTIVTGYKSDLLKDYVISLNPEIPVAFIENKDYSTTNNIYSLYLARNILCQNDVLLFESDLIFEDRLINLLLDDERPSLALVDKYKDWMDGTCVKIDSDGKILSFISKKDFNPEQKSEYYKTVNVYKFSKKFSSELYVPYLESFCQKYGRNDYYEQVLKEIICLDEPHFAAFPLSGQLWYEIDNENDLKVAESLFV